MKIRTDFVTNSSSSSFIISTNTALSGDMAQYMKPVSRARLAEELIEEFGYDNLDNEELLSELGGFTQEQLLLIKLATLDWELLPAYKRALDSLDEGNLIYIGCVPSEYTHHPDIRTNEILLCRIN